jgi:hypothetical protein
MHDELEMIDFFFAIFHLHLKASETLIKSPIRLSPRVNEVKSTSVSVVISTY